MRRYAFLSYCLLLLPGLTYAQTLPPTEQLALVDVSRCRHVPIAIYKAASFTATPSPKLAVISHGYGGHNTDYSFIAEALTKQSYLVAAVQHEVPGDEPLPLTGNARVVRRPNWERGVQNIRFAVGELKKRYPQLNTRELLLVGHSNGGDQSMLYATMYPAEVAYVISLDNRRMPFPRARRPRLLSIRSADQVADAGVLPTPAQQRTYGMVIGQLDIAHNDMWDGATPEQRKAMLAVITQFLPPR